MSESEKYYDELKKRREEGELTEAERYYQERKKKEAAGELTEAERGYKQYKADKRMAEIVDVYNKMIARGSAANNEYDLRFNGEGVDNNAYRSDTAYYLNRVNKSKGKYDEDAAWLTEALAEYKDYYDKDLYDQISKGITDYGTMYDAILGTATENDKYFSQFKNEGDYNFRTAIANGADEAALRELFDGMKSGYASLDDFYNDIDYAEDMDLRFSFDPERYNKNAERIAEIDNLLNGNILQDVGDFIVENTGIDTERERERNALRRERKRLVEENRKYMPLVDPEGYEAMLDEEKKWENASVTERILATAQDVVQPIAYGATSAVENLAEFIPRGYMAYKDLSHFLNSKVLGLVPGGAEESQRQTKEWNGTKQKMTDFLNVDLANELTGFNERSEASKRASYLNGSIQDIIYDVGAGVGNMAPAAAITLLNPALGSAVFFGSAAGGAANEASNAGADAGTAFLYGAASGAFESLSEKLGGSVLGEAADLGATPIGRQLLKSGLGKYIDHGLGKAAYSFTAEGMEEVFMDVVSPGLKASFNTGDSREKYFGKNGIEGWKEVLRGLPETFTVGGAVGAVYEGLNAGASAIKNMAAVRGNGWSSGVALNSISKELGTIANTVKAGAAIDQSTTATQVKKNEFAIASNNRVMDSVNKISASMKSLTAEQRNAIFKEAPILESYIDADGNVSAGIKEAIKASNDALNKRTPAATNAKLEGKSAEEIGAQVTRQLATGKGQVSDTAQRTKLASTISNIVQGKEFSKSAINKVVKNERALKVLNDYLGTKLTSNANARDVRLAVAEKSGDNSYKGQAEKFSAILDLGKNGTRGLANIVKGAKGINIGNLAQAFNDVYRLGKKGADIDLAKNPYLSMLSEEQMVLAYNYGIMDGAIEASEKKSSDEVSLDRDTAENVPKHNDGENGPGFLDEKKVDEAQSQVDAAKRNAKKKKGTVVYDGDRSKLSDMQKKSLDVLDKVAEALGVTFRIYESERVNGRFVYKMPDGAVKSANGWYDTKTGEIWLDINAGLNGEGALIFTAAHELTHFIKQWSPKKFKIFADFLIEQYGERGISIDELVQRRIDKAKKNGEDIDPDVAYEEVIADSCETFLRDSNAAEKIVELNQKDASLAQKIKRFLGDMLKRLRELMRDLKPQSREGRIVSEMTSSLQELYDLWADALADAGEAYSGVDADIHSHTDGDILYSERYSYETLVNKPDMKLTTINNVVQQKPTKSMRQTAVDTALKNAKAIGKIDSTGAVSVYVDDLGNDVILSKKSLGHGLDRRFSENLPATLQAGEILKNAIRINELSPKVKTANASYVLIGAAKSPNGDLSIVEFVVNEFTNEVASIDVLKSINTKKEAAVLNAPPPTNNSLRITASSISIAQLLDFVNRYFPDILPESVWRHYGHAVRPDGELGKSALFSDRDYDAPTNREILANLLETEDMSPSEKGFLTKYKNKIAQIEANEAEISSMESELAELKKVGKKNSSRAITLEGKIENRRKEIARDERLILNLEATKPIRDLLNRERDLAYAEGMLAGQMAQGKDDAAKLRRAEEKLAYQKRKDGEALAEYKKRVAEREAKIKAQHAAAKQRASDRRHSSEIRGKIKAFKDKLQKALQHPTDRQYIPGALAQAIIDVCELIDTDTELYKADGSINKAQERREKTRERLRILRAEYNNIAKDADPLFAQEYDAAIAEYLEELESKFSGKSLNDMSRAELEEMYKILHSIDGTLREARKLIGGKEAADVYETGDAIIEEQKKIAGERKNGKRGAIKKINDGAGNLSLSPMRRVLEICGYDKNSPLYKLFKGLEEGVRKAEFFKMGAKKSFEALTTRKNADVYEKAIYEADGGNKYTDVNGRKFGISKMQKMQAILSYERETANKKTHHIEKGGLIFADLSELGKGKLKVAVDAEHSHKVAGYEADQLVEQFKKDLEGDRWAQNFMKAARFFFNNTSKTAINDTYMQLKHRILATDDAYIPFETDPNSIAREISAEYDAQPTISALGMLKETQTGASNALVMTGLNNILDRHIEQVSIVYGLAVPIRNFNKVWNTRSIDGTTFVKEQVEKVAGASASKLIQQTVMDLQGDRPIKHEAFSRVYKKIKSNYIAATFFANMSVMFKQIGSMFSATAVIGYRSPVRMMGNLIYTFANSKKIAAEVDKYTATAWMRHQGLSDAELKTLKTERRKTKAGKVFDGVGSFLMIEMDYHVALSLWKYAKQDVAKKTGLRGEELLNATAEYYDEVIETTQSMTDVLHRPEIQKGGGVGTELLGTFKTDLYQNAGNLRIAMGEFAHSRTKENAKKLVKTVSAIMTSALWGSIVTSLVALARYKVGRYRDEEDDELTPESWFKVQGMDLLQELAGYMVPSGGSEVFEAVTNIREGKSFGNIVASAIPFDAVNDLYSDICTLWPKLREGEELTRSDYFKIIKDCGNVLGIPTSNLLRVWEAGELHVKDALNGEPLSFEAGLEDPNAYRLYKAMLEGDESKIKKASRHFDNEEDISSAIRKQLREHDPRIREAAMAYKAGDLDRWDELRHEILDEGIFDKEDIEEAIKSERNSYTSKVKEAAQAKVDGKDEDYDSIVDELFEKYETVVDEDELLDEIDEAADLIKDSEGATEEEYFWYSISDVNGWFNSGDTERAMEVLDELKQIKTESSLQSSVTTYWKPKYIEAYQSGNTDEMWRIKEILEATGFYEDVRKTTKNWVKGK